jgi:hypothetical protein
MKSLTEPVKLGEKPLQTVNQTVHLGIIRVNFSVKLLQFRYLRYI